MLKYRQVSFLLFLFFSILALPKIALADHHAVILQYHHISDKTPKSTSVAPETFAEHLDYLEKNHFNVLPLTQVTEALQKKAPLPDKAVVITFDDAYLNIYENAFPLLKKKGWPFTLFVSTEPVDRNFGEFLNWSQIQEMTKYGASIANHTTAHDHLVEIRKNESTTSWLDRVEKDITATEQRIQEKTGQSLKHFAWPYGEATPELRALISKLGYIGLGQQSGAAGYYSDFTRLPRYPMASSYADMNKFKLKVNSLPLPVIAQMPDSSLITRQNLKPRLELSLEKGPYQKDQLRCYATDQGELEVKWLDKNKTRFETTAKSPLPEGRSRYNCTAPSNSGKQYYWYSHTWLRLTESGKAKH
ncbi:polysaccharide deacetylase family protein [Endozoicomonas sp. Mp262]|uniref:polysaccharide deacetylase family protein n=1 Tax=Endozoicomonas sp. Mp262 TaxID=2919499 RepID=UPI0021DAE837